MKAILTKPEKERLLEQFEKSKKTHAQFAEENGLYEMYEFETDWYQEVLNFCNHYEVKLDEYKSGYSNNYIYYLEIPALQFSSQGEGRSPEVARLKAAEALRHDCEIYDMKQEVGEADFDTSVSQLNELFQKEYITQPEYSFKNTTDSDGHQIWRCESFISAYEDKEACNEVSEKRIQKLKLRKLRPLICFSLFMMKDKELEYDRFFSDFKCKAICFR